MSTRQSAIDENQYNEVNAIRVERDKLRAENERLRAVACRARIFLDVMEESHHVSSFALRAALDALDAQGVEAEGEKP